MEEVAPFILNILHSNYQFLSIGVCEGDGTSCLGCFDTDNFETLLEMDGNGLAQFNLVRQSGRALRNVTRKSKTIKRRQRRANLKLARKSIASARELYQENWVLSWTLPQVSTSCANLEFCAQSDNFDTIDAYNTNALTMRQLTDELLDEIREVRGRLRKADKTRRETNETLYLESLEASESVPRFSSSCT